MLRRSLSSFFNLGRGLSVGAVPTPLKPKSVPAASSAQSSSSPLVSPLPPSLMQQITVASTTASSIFAGSSALALSTTTNSERNALTTAPSKPNAAAVRAELSPLVAAVTQRLNAIEQAQRATGARRLADFTLDDCASVLRLIAQLVLKHRKSVHLASEAASASASPPASDGETAVRRYHRHHHPRKRRVPSFAYLLQHRARDGNKRKLLNRIESRVVDIALTARSSQQFSAILFSMHQLSQLSGGHYNVADAALGRVCRAWIHLIKKQQQEGAEGIKSIAMPFTLPTRADAAKTLFVLGSLAIPYERSPTTVQLAHHLFSSLFRAASSDAAGETSASPIPKLTPSGAAIILSCAAHYRISGQLAERAATELLTAEHILRLPIARCAALLKALSTWHDPPPSSRNVFEAVVFKLAACVPQTRKEEEIMVSACASVVAVIASKGFLADCDDGAPLDAQGRMSKTEQIMATIAAIVKPILLPSSQQAEDGGEESVSASSSTRADRQHLAFPCLRLIAAMNRKARSTLIKRESFANGNSNLSSSSSAPCPLLEDAELRAAVLRGVAPLINGCLRQVKQQQREDEEEAERSRLNEERTMKNLKDTMRDASKSNNSNTNNNNNSGVDGATALAVIEDGKRTVVTTDSGSRSSNGKFRRGYTRVLPGQRRAEHRALEAALQFAVHNDLLLRDDVDTDGSSSGSTATSSNSSSHSIVVRSDLRQLSAQLAHHATNYVVAVASGGVGGGRRQSSTMQVAPQTISNLIRLVGHSVNNNNVNNNGCKGSSSSSSILSPEMERQLFQCFLSHATGALHPRDYAACTEALFSFFGGRVDEIALDKIVSVLSDPNFTHRLSFHDSLAIARGWSHIARGSGANVTAAAAAAARQRTRIRRSSPVDDDDTGSVVVAVTQPLQQLAEDGSGGSFVRPDPLAVQHLYNHVRFLAPKVTDIHVIQQALSAMDGINCLTPAMFASLARGFRDAVCGNVDDYVIASSTSSQPVTLLSQLSEELLSSFAASSPEQDRKLKTAICAVLSTFQQLAVEYTTNAYKGADAFSDSRTAVRAFVIDSAFKFDAAGIVAAANALAVLNSADRAVFGVLCRRALELCNNSNDGSGGEKRGDRVDEESGSSVAAQLFATQLSCAAAGALLLASQQSSATSFSAASSLLPALLFNLSRAAPEEWYPLDALVTLDGLAKFFFVAFDSSNSDRSSAVLPAIVVSSWHRAFESVRGAIKMTVLVRDDGNSDAPAPAFVPRQHFRLDPESKIAETIDPAIIVSVATSVAASSIVDSDIVQPALTTMLREVVLRRGDADMIVDALACCVELSSPRRRSAVPATATDTTRDVSEKGAAVVGAAVAAATTAARHLSEQVALIAPFAVRLPSLSQRLTKASSIALAAHSLSSVSTALTQSDSESASAASSGRQDDPGEHTLLEPETLRLLGVAAMRLFPAPTKVSADLREAVSVLGR